MNINAELAVRTSGLSRRFGDLWAVSGVDLEIRTGSLVAVLGPNGAGKTTTLSMVSGILAPTSGRVEIFGRKLEEEPETCKRLMGVVHERLNLHEHLTAREHLQFTGLVYGLSRTDIERRSRELIELLSLTECASRPISTYSHGTKKKTALASALIHRPRLLLLDEPFEGLDPVTARIVSENLKAMAREGAAVVITSHVLERVEKLCSRVVMIRNGAIALDSSIDQLVTRNASRAIPRDLESAVLEVLGRSVDERDVLSWLAREAS
jgi:ABC-2 type transport system ATP-binding protein